ncbi:MAG: DUF3606 domain-containing protein [Peptococcaceae bacterium]|nr:DUF3606 domain-containing protein [Peptococcaceae bacterium]
MPEDLPKKRPDDTSKVNIHDQFEVRWWCHELGCTESELKSAVYAVGTSADEVRKHLNK